MKNLLILSFCVLFSIPGGGTNLNKPPHIIIIYADDLGWNDVSFHGSPEIPTPNIDALAMNGILLNNYYGENLCTPSRAALLTGKYPIRLGLQHGVLKGGEASGLPLKEITLPQHLKSLGYSTHMIGKWHLGYMTKEYTPTYRGFDSFFGYYNGILDYYDYTSDTITGLHDIPYYYGIDLYNGSRLLRDFRGQYATHVFTEEARNIILNQDQKKPLFLYLAHLAVHSGSRYNPVQAPAEIIRKFKYIKNLNRRIQAAMTSVLDDSVGEIIKALRQRNMLDNSIIVFASDNGGQVNGFHGGYSSNYPLRSRKRTLWEGGVRLPALIWSPLLKLKESRVSKQLMHVSDWLPTLYFAAGGNPDNLGILDGHNMWPSLVAAKPSPRTDLLHGLDPIVGFSAFRKGDWKLVNGTNGEGYDGWYGPTGTENINVTESMDKWVFSKGSVVGDILKQTEHWLVKDVDKWYSESLVQCNKYEKENAFDSFPHNKPSLFNIKDDPCEYLNLASFYPEIVDAMMEEIKLYQKVSVEPQSKPGDRNANPMCYGFAHVTWMEPEFSAQYEQCDFSDQIQDSLNNNNVNSDTCTLKKRNMIS
nr:arylsulfatase B isoform X1 [Parasteatoda tepidariorum]XP_042902749.1 arylsulfatase B isoform X2 [Parasteatoda tepidariorum]